MIRTGSITSPGRTVTLAAPVQHGSMGVDARPEGPLASLGHVTKGELCREQALVFGAVAPRTHMGVQVPRDASRTQRVRRLLPSMPLLRSLFSSFAQMLGHARIGTARVARPGWSGRGCRRGIRR